MAWAGRRIRGPIGRPIIPTKPKPRDVSDLHLRRHRHICIECMQPIEDAGRCDKCRQALDNPCYTTEACPENGGGET